MNTRTFTAAALAGIAFTTALHAADWPAWGGADPGRNMFSDAKGIPAKFEPGKFKKNSEEIDMATTQNVKWITKLGSQTYGNTVVAYGSVYIGTNNASARDHLLCLVEMTQDESATLQLRRHSLCVQKDAPESPACD